jgi:hypothetical protein
VRSHICEIIVHQIYKMEFVQARSVHQLKNLWVEELKTLCETLEIDYPGTCHEAAVVLWALVEANNTEEGGEGVSPPSQELGQLASSSSSSSPSLSTTTTSSGGLPPAGDSLAIQGLSNQIVQLALVMTLQVQQIQMLQQCLDGGELRGPDKYPDWKFSSAWDQQEYGVLVEILCGLCKIVPTMTAQALMQVHKLLIVVAEVQAATLVVADMDRWTTASLLSQGTTVLFIKSQWAPQVEVACKCAKVEAKASSFWSNQGCSCQDGSGDSLTCSNDDQPSQGTRRSSKQDVVCYKCYVPGHYTNHCPNNKPQVSKKPCLGSK